MNNRKKAVMCERHVLKVNESWYASHIINNPTIINAGQKWLTNPFMLKVINAFGIVPLVLL